MFRSNCRTIFRVIFEQVERVVDNAFNLRDLVLHELFKIIVVYYIKDLRLILSSKISRKMALQLGRNM
jgi:hypothetical protein